MVTKDMLIYREIKESDNAAVAAIIRTNLEKFGLDIPGTAYFDEGLDHLSRSYGDEKHRYYVLEDEKKGIIGSVGFSECDLMDDTAELQKLYLTEGAKGSGLGYEMIAYVEDRMRESGFRKSYLETHDVLSAAIHIYEKSGYREIEKPEKVVHSSMNRFFLKEL